MELITPKNIEQLPELLHESILLVDKPLRWSSFHVVRRIQNQLKKRFNLKELKVGHTGTLDPMATGLMLVCIGRATKQTESFQELPKTYTGVIRLGATTPSFDSEKEINAVFPIEHITRELLEQKKMAFLGDIEQVPPVFSAVKVNGKPIYKKARKGHDIVLKPRPVSIYQFELGEIALPDVPFEIQCSKGTYIRSIANDLGAAVESGGYLAALTRTAVGNFRIANAWNIDHFVETIRALPFVNPRKK